MTSTTEQTETAQPESGGGRPSDICEVNPIILNRGANELEG